DELVLSAHRMLKIPLGSVERAVVELKSMGQAVAQAPSPQGWPDRAEDWLSADALRKRVQWADRFGDLNRHAADARGLARLAWGEDLSQSSRSQIDNADSSAQALAWRWRVPEFQRR
ncbi:MAG: DUF1800 family protein, partial [Betaproteobacteria bacterium]|nr:DUF1800 family protein [Betaproteobacteria bacterium]